jgi:hypothetical protein
MMLTKILNKHEESVQRYGKAYYRITDFISDKGIKDYDDKILDNLAGLKKNKAILTQVEDAFERGDNLTRRSILNAMSESSDVNTLLSNSKFKNTLESYKQLTSRFKGDDLDEIVEKINDLVDSPATVEGIGGIAQGLARDYSVRGALKALGYNIPGGGKISGIGEEVKRSFFGSIIDGIKSIIG